MVCLLTLFGVGALELVDVHIYIVHGDFALRQHFTKTLVLLRHNFSVLFTSHTIVLHFNGSIRSLFLFLQTVCDVVTFVDGVHADFSSN